MNLRVKKQKKLKNNSNSVNNFLKELFLSEKDIEIDNLSPKFKNSFEAVEWLKQKDNNFN